MESTDNRANEVEAEEPAPDKSKDEMFTLHATATDRARFPDLNGVRSVTLKEGPRSRRIAKYTEIRDRHSGEVHHHALSIVTFKKLQGEWGESKEHSVTLSTEANDEIQTLLHFLGVVRGNSAPTVSADYLVVPAPEGVADKEGLQEFVNDLSDKSRIDVLTKVLDFATKIRRCFKCS